MTIKSMRVSVVGWIAGEPKFAYTSGGKALLTFSFAAKDSSYSNKDKSPKDKKTFWINVNVWGEYAETLSTLLKKGAPVMVEGRFSFEAWTSKKDGQEKDNYVINADSVLHLEQEKPAQKTEEGAADEDTAGDMPF